jgi:hypothetical protein
MNQGCSFLQTGQAFAAAPPIEEKERGRNSGEGGRYNYTVTIMKAECNFRLGRFRREVACRSVLYTVYMYL